MASLKGKLFTGAGENLQTFIFLAVEAGWEMGRGKGHDSWQGPSICHLGRPRPWGSRMDGLGSGRILPVLFHHLFHLFCSRADFFPLFIIVYIIESNAYSLRGMGLRLGWEGSDMEENG